MEQSYEDYMTEVDAVLVARIGLGHRDLPDYRTMDAFNDDVDTSELAYDIAANACESMSADIDEVWP